MRGDSLTYCQTCDLPTPPGTNLCDGCADRLDQQLIRIPSLVADLEITITRQDRLGKGRVGSRGNEKPLAFNVGASDADGDLRNALAAWAARVCWTGIVTAKPAARWLWLNRELVVAHPYVGRLYEDVTAAIAQALLTVDHPPDRTYAGPCSTCGTDGYALPGDTGAVCGGCGAILDVEQGRAAMLARAALHTATADQAAGMLTALGVSVSYARIRQWHRRGHLEPADWVTTSKGRPQPRFCLGDVLRVTAQIGTRLPPPPEVSDTPHS